MPVDPYEAPVSETPAQKRERLMHLNDENWKPGDDPTMPPEPVVEKPAPVVAAPAPSSPVAESEPPHAPAPAPARAVRGSGDAQRKG